MDSDEYPMLSPDFFYDVGKNPAYMDFAFIRAANYDQRLKEEHKYRTQYQEHYMPRRFFFFKDFKELFEDKLEATSIPKSLMFYAGIMGVCMNINTAMSGFYPFGLYGIRNFRDLHVFKRFGMVGVALPATVMFVSTFTMYRVSLYMGKKIWNYGVHNKRDWDFVRLRNETEFGDYGYEDQVYNTKENRVELGRTMTKMMQIRHEHLMKEKDGVQSEI